MWFRGGAHLRNWPGSLASGAWCIQMNTREIRQTKTRQTQTRLMTIAKPYCYSNHFQVPRCLYNCIFMHCNNRDRSHKTHLWQWVAPFWNCFRWAMSILRTVSAIPHVFAACHTTHFMVHSHIGFHSSHLHWMGDVVRCQSELLIHLCHITAIAGVEQKLKTS